METNKLYRIAEKSGISVERYPLEKNTSVSVSFNGNMYVALDEHITVAQERVSLAHELGHCETMSFYNIYSPLDIRAKHEKRADRWAIQKLIPKYAFIRAIKNGYDNIYSLSEHFCVTPDFMKKVIDYYGTK